METAGGGRREKEGRSHWQTGGEEAVKTKEKGEKSIREKEAGKERRGIHPEYKGTSVRFGLRKSKAFQEPGCWITQPTFHHLAEYSLLQTAKVKIAGFIVGIYATERETRPSQ